MGSVDVFSKAKSMDFPRSVILGHDAILKTRDLCDSLKFGEAGVMVTGGESYSAAGRAICESMSERYDVRVVRTGIANSEGVDRVCAEVEGSGASFILAVGGGSKIDTAKMAAKKTGMPFVSIPTSVSHDGIASDRASLKSDAGSNSVAAVSPIGIIADTSVISAAPYRYLASGCADVISNLTALKDWELARKEKSEEFSSSAYFLAKYAADNLVENCGLIKSGMEESVWLVMRPIIASGISMCAAGSSRPTSGSEHMFSHALDTLYPGKKSLHGEQCGIGAIMMMCLHGGDWKTILEALRTIGAPTTAEELELADDDIIEALVMARSMREDRYTILGDKGISRREARSVAKRTGVIGGRRRRSHRQKPPCESPE
ncbi:MAG: NAD(P)-dependent glycerol-1-phosphate dehydrogenase [Candidatus Methanoplasma sp.]|jgi:glycerol-1-phosphate dehydrogenase [NAD(P)+]|nr:NAD(P)-dependent glycerol-1-phosphate dehydrogenase [Candidatus Methanoplasma sp.]